MTRLKLRLAVLTALLATNIAATPAAASNDDPQWPNVAPNDLPDPPINPRPAFLHPEQVTDRILGLSVAPVPANLDVDITGATARWPNLPPEPFLPVKQPLSPYVFEIGARYWYSSGTIQFGFSNGHPLFGTPTSTLDWKGMTAHIGELFARVDHRPSGWFAKGVFGMGGLQKGHIDDADYVIGQFRFSDTRSNVTSGNVTFAMMDVGWAYQPAPNIHLGFFVGYHYWREKVAANGVVCIQASVFITSCPSGGSTVVGFDTEVLIYEPTWHAVRIGVETRIPFADRWSFSGEIALVPYAMLQNKDSHLLRQDPADLGPAPNVITNSKYAYGVETEMFINYAVTPNLEISGGVRYWGLASSKGDVRFGPSFDAGGTLTRFDQQRFGVLLQIKGRF